jgi:hypothetical protein
MYKAKKVHWYTLWGHLPNTDSTLFQWWWWLKVNLDLFFFSWRHGHQKNEILFAWQATMHPTSVHYNQYKMVSDLVTPSVTQHCIIKFLVKEIRKPADILPRLNALYAEETLSRAEVYDWYNNFSESCKEVSNLPHSTNRPLNKGKKLPVLSFLCVYF